MDDVFDALAQEHAALDAMLTALEPQAWAQPSRCSGWTVADVVLHLAQSEEMVAASVDADPGSRRWPEGATTIEDVVEGWVASERGASPREILDRWRTASRSALDALRGAGPDARFAWATVPLKARTLATTRLAEHWIHANDVAVPLGLPYRHTERLRHIARLAHRTIPYAFSRAGRSDPPEVHLVLEAPSGEEWTFGSPDAPCRISGSAIEFCEIAGRRLDATDARTVEATGDRADEVLELVRTFA